MMRITNNMMAQNTIRNITNNMLRLDAAQTKMATQSEFQHASDNPIAATKALKYRNYVSTITQYQKNASDATSWMTVTESALSSLNDIVQKARDLTVEASGTLTDSDKTDIAAEISQIKSSALETLNSTYAGRYIFGGYLTNEAPYAEKSITVGSATLSTITFKGQYLSLGGAVGTSVDATELSSFYNNAKTNNEIYTSVAAQNIKYSTGYSSETAVNVEGQNLTGTGVVSLFVSLDKLLLCLNGATQYQTVDSSGTVSAKTVSLSDSTSTDSVLSDIDKNLSLISMATADLGARMNYVDTCTSRLANDYMTYTGLLSSVEDVDISKASVEESTAQTVYDASLTVGAKVISTTLVDYLK